MKSLVLVGTVGCFALAIGYGCSVEVKETTTAAGSGGGGGKKPTGVVTVAQSGSSGPTSGAGGAGGMMMLMDESTSCSDAVEMKPETTMAGLKFSFGDGVIATAGDKDYYKFTAKKDTWIRLATSADPMDEMGKIDTVITLFKDGKQLAQADDYYPRAATKDSEFDYHVTEDGTYCLEVQEFSSWKQGESPKGDPSFTYRALLIPLDAESNKVLKNLNVDAGNNDTAGTAQEVKNLFVSSMNPKLVAGDTYGLLDTKTDKDIFKVTTPAGAASQYFQFEPGGTSGNGGTGGIGTVNVYNADGTTLIAQLKYNEATAKFDAGGSYGFSFIPAAEKTTYLLEINRNGNDPGANDFYYFKWGTGDGTGFSNETNNDANKLSATAEQPAEKQGTNMKTLYHRFAGTLPAGDVDYWKFTAKANDSLGIACSSARAGSNVDDMKVELFQDPDKAALQTETESKTQDLSWFDQDGSMKAVKAAAGTHYLKVSSTKAIANGPTSSHYWCYVGKTAP